MIVPLHLLPAAGQTAPTLPDFSHSAPVQPDLSGLGLTIAGAVEMSDLLDFQRLMLTEGQTLQPTRMLYDRLYAFERLALAHASASSVLREKALQLFQRYQQAGEWIGLIH